MFYSLKCSSRNHWASSISLSSMVNLVYLPLKKPNIKEAGKGHGWEPKYEIFDPYPVLKTSLRTACSKVLRFNKPASVLYIFLESVMIYSRNFFYKTQVWLLRDLFLENGSVLLFYLNILIQNQLPLFCFWPTDTTKLVSQMPECHSFS